VIGDANRGSKDRRFIQTVDKALRKNMREAARSGRFVSHKEVARRVEIAVQDSHPSVRRSELQRNPLDVFLARQRQQHEVLLLETESADCRGLLREMQADCEVFGQFANWTEVATHMENGKIRRRETDAVLIPIFERMEWDENPYWQTILVVLFWNFLKEEHRFKKNWCPEVDDRWQNVVLAFLFSVRNLDLTRRQVGLAQKLANDTVHHLCDFCRRFAVRDWQQNAVQSCDPEILETLEARKSVRVEARDLQQFLVRRVLEMAEQKVISEWAADVLIATRLEGRRLKDLRLKDCNYETAKKRRQREEAKLLRAFPIWERVMMVA